MRNKGVCFLLLLAWLMMIRPAAAVDQPCSLMPSGSYWVFFTDKKNSSFDPYEYFHPAAIERRLRHGVDLYDSLDFPVAGCYLQQLATLVDSATTVLRWFNAVKVTASQEQLMQVSRLPFVKKIKPSHPSMMPAGLDLNRSATAELSPTEMLQLAAQTDHLQGYLFGQHGIDGQGIRIAVFDGGFPGVDTHLVFRHLAEQQRLVKTWDFHRNREDVFRHSSHGTMVLSTLAGLYDSIPMGLATGAEYLLARTEIWREPFFEEEYWLAAMEWADRHGAHIINSSVGYSYHRYFPEDMDGQTSLVAQAAAIAFDKGILVVNSAGNSGLNELWRVVSTPADSPRVLSVGAISYPSMLRASYSSRGPTADGRLKPDLAAIGNVVVANEAGITQARGTSFSSPLVAGFAACLWQMFPEWTNQDLLQALQYSGHLHPYFDYDHGYGIPQASYFFTHPGMVSPDSFDFIEGNGTLIVRLRYIISDVVRDDPLDAYLYYHIRDSQGAVEQYFVVLAQQQDVLELAKADFEPGQQVVVHFRGFTAAWTF